jgi:hypothetical protein
MRGRRMRGPPGSKTSQRAPVSFPQLPNISRAGRDRRRASCFHAAAGEHPLYGCEQNLRFHRRVFPHTTLAGTEVAGSAFTILCDCQINVREFQIIGLSDERIVYRALAILPGTNDPTDARTGLMITWGTHCPLVPCMLSAWDITRVSENSRLAGVSSVSGDQSRRLVRP